MNKTTVSTVVRSSKGVVESSSFDLTKITATRADIRSFFQSKHTTEEIVLVLKCMLEKEFTRDEMHKLTGLKKYQIDIFCHLTNLEPSLLKIAGSDVFEGKFVIPLATAEMLAKVPHEVQLRIWNTVTVKNKRKYDMILNLLRKYLRNGKPSHIQDHILKKIEREPPSKPAKKLPPKPKTEIPAPKVDMNLVRRAILKFGLGSQKLNPTLKLRTVNMPVDEPDEITLGPSFTDSELNPTNPEYQAFTGD